MSSAFTTTFQSLQPTALQPGELGFILNNCDDGQIKDPGPNQYLQITQYTEAWVLSGNATVYTTQPAVPPPAGIARIHYYRPDGNYSGWGLYAWNAAAMSYSWCSSQVAQSGTDSYGVYFDVPINPANGTPPGQLGLPITQQLQRKARIKDPGPNQYLQVTQFTTGLGHFRRRYGIHNRTNSLPDRRRRPLSAPGLSGSTALLSPSPPAAINPPPPPRYSIR